jgi:hypothetical protein
MRSLAFAMLLLAGCSDVGSAVIDENGQLTARNDKPFPVLSSSKVIPAAMALERGDASLVPLVRLSVINSNNEAADQLTARLGGPQAVRGWLRSKGLPSAFATEREMLARPTIYQLRPSELALIVRRIQTPELVALMAQTKTGNDRIRAVYPNAPHKSGTLRGYLVDVGIVNGRVIVVMGANAKPRDLAAIL